MKKLFIAWLVLLLITLGTLKMVLTPESPLLIVMGPVYFALVLSTIILLYKLFQKKFGNAKAILWTVLSSAAIVIVGMYLINTLFVW